MKSQKACFDQYGTVCEHLSGGCQRNRFYYCSFVMARLSFLYVFNASCQQQCARVTRLRYLQRRTQENKISKNKKKQTNKQKHTPKKTVFLCSSKGNLGQPPNQEKSTYLHMLLFKSLPRDIWPFSQRYHFTAPGQCLRNLNVVPGLPVHIPSEWRLQVKPTFYN